MKTCIRKCASWVGQHKWFLIGVVLVTLFVFNNYRLGYQLSFTNVNYSFLPFSSTGTLTDGPMLSDVADSHYPSVYATFYDDEGLNLWESDVSLGRSSGAVAFLMNPLEWVCAFPLPVAIFLKAFLEFAMAFFFMYLFMRSFGNGRFASAVSGGAYAFSAVIVVWLGWPHSDVAALAPLLFFAIERLIATVRIRYALLIALVIYVMLMVGMPTYAAYFLYLAGVYIVIFTIKRYWRGQKKTIFAVGGLFALAVVLAAAASLPYTYTLLESVASNGYMDSRASYAEVQLPWSYLRTVLYPYVRDGLTLHMNESTLYVGVASIVLLPLALFRLRRKKRNAFFLISAVVVFLLIFTDVFNAVYVRMPMINTSLKYRVITLLTFIVAALTGISLNDVLENREAYKRWRLVAIPCMILWTYAVFVTLTKGMVEQYSKTAYTVFGLAMAIISCMAVLMFLKKKRRVLNGVVCTVLVVIVLFDGGSFAREYLPWIDKEASVIPEPTDSVAYLVENTQDEARVSGIGLWTMFPNTPSYYDLNDIRSHGFEMTNDDIKAYYTAIDSSAYDTRTRVTIKTIENDVLLQYLGVKYIYGSDVGTAVPLVSDAGHSKVFGPFVSNTTLSQDCYLEKAPDAFSILMATYGNILQSKGDITLSLISRDSNEVVMEASVAVNSIVDNSYVNFAVPPDAVVVPGYYTVTLAVGDLQGDTLTVWMKETDNSVVQSADQTVSGCMAMNAIYCRGAYQIVYSGADSLLIAQADAFTDKAELIETVYTFDTQEEILQTMAQEYKDNTAFMLAEDAALVYDRPLEDSEDVQVLEYRDDYVKVQYTSQYDRYITLNDYFDEDWSVYVNGEKAELRKSNYLMRAVTVGAAQDGIVEFRYEPRSYYTVVAVSLVTIVLTLALLIFAKKPQALLDKLLMPKSATSGQMSEFCKSEEQTTFMKDGAE